MQPLATVYFLTVRSLREAIRNPAQEVGNIFVPLFFFAVTVGSIGSIAADAFGIDNFTGFQVPVAILSAASSISASAGLGTITDIQRGYFDKLLLTPAPRSAIVLGRIAADGVRSVIITGVIVVVGLIFRTGFDTGVLGVVVLLAGSFFFGTAYSGFNAAVALRTGSPQAAAAGGLLLFPSSSSPPPSPRKRSSPTGSRCSPPSTPSPTSSRRSDPSSSKAGTASTCSGAPLPSSASASRRLR